MIPLQSSSHFPTCYEFFNVNKLAVLKIFVSYKKCAFSHHSLIKYYEFENFARCACGGGGGGLGGVEKSQKSVSLLFILELSLDAKFFNVFKYIIYKYLKIYIFKIYIFKNYNPSMFCQKVKYIKFNLVQLQKSSIRYFNLKTQVFEKKVSSMNRKGVKCKQVNRCLVGIAACLFRPAGGIKLTQGGKWLPTLQMERQMGGARLPCGFRVTVLTSQMHCSSGQSRFPPKQTYL